MNYLLLIQTLIILVVGMKLGVLIYKKEFDFEFLTDVLIAIIWITLISFQI